jgi:hypothetical protein
MYLVSLVSGQWIIVEDCLLRKVPLSPWRDNWLIAVRTLYPETGNVKANKNVPSAAHTLAMEPERGETGSAAERSEGVATTSGSVTAYSRPNTNTVSSGIKLEKVLLTL